MMTPPDMVFWKKSSLTCGRARAAIQRDSRSTQELLCNICWRAAPKAAELHLCNLVHIPPYAHTRRWKVRCFSCQPALTQGRRGAVAGRRAARKWLQRTSTHATHVARMHRERQGKTPLLQDRQARRPPWGRRLAAGARPKRRPPAPCLLSTPCC